MSGHDVAVPQVLRAIGGFVLLIALAVGAVLALLSFWNEPFGGVQSSARALLPVLEAGGATLQSAPQDERAAYVAAKAQQRAASEAAR